MKFGNDIPSHRDFDMAMTGKTIKCVSVYVPFRGEYFNLELVFTDYSKVRFKIIDYTI